MEKAPVTYTLYFFRKADEVATQEKSAIEIVRSNDNAGFERNDLVSLAKEFVSFGWRISQRDRLQTISPIILNKWDSRPWNPNYGIESLLEKGEIVFFRGLTPTELDTFYQTYLSEVNNRA